VVVVVGAVRSVPVAVEEGDEQPAATVATATVPASPHAAIIAMRLVRNPVPLPNRPTKPAN
jgi:hypothetical protein